MSRKRERSFRGRDGVRSGSAGAGGAAEARRGRAFVTLIASGFLLLGLVLVFHHEPWRDEADPWLMVRDSTPAEVFRLAPYAGTPVLWHFVQMPLAKLGLPYASIGIVNLAFATVAVVLFNACAPLPAIVRLLFTFSFFMSYEYAAIARSYALSVMLLFGLASLHRKRDRCSTDR